MSAPDALIWEVVKRTSSFLYRRNGNTRRTGTITLTAEPYNLTKKNTFKDSGLANSRALDVSIKDREKHGAAVVLSSKSKKNANKPAKLAHKTVLHKAPRTSAKSIKGYAKVNYRADLQRAALARYSALKRVVDVANGKKKPMKVKKGRGNNA